VTPTWLRLGEERDGPDSRTLDAELQADGAVQFSGQDLGPLTAAVSDDGEYEYWFRVEAHDHARAVAALGGRPGEALMTVLQRAWSGPQAFRIRRTLDAAGIATHLSVYS
jgi:hypothetical protein